MFSKFCLFVEDKNYDADKSSMSNELTDDDVKGRNKGIALEKGDMILNNVDEESREKR